MNGADKPRRTTALDHGLGQLRHIGHGDRRSNISEGHAVPRRSAEGIELLADPTRRRIVALVASRVWRPADIAVAIGLSRPAISRQLRLLTDAGLLRWRWSVIDRRSRDYFVDPPMKEPIIAWLAGVDLRNVRPAFNATWSPPARIHRLRHAAKNVEFDRKS